METNGELRKLVAGLLAQRWSPQQISRHLRLKFPEQSRMRFPRFSGGSRSWSDWAKGGADCD
jgi:hypothetical protein